MFVCGEFSTFSLKFGAGKPLPINTQINGVGEFLFFASFKSYNHVTEENTCFIKTQSLTACQKQITQVIKISLTPPFREKCQEDIAMLISCSRSNPTGNELISELRHFGKKGGLFGIEIKNLDFLL